MASIEYFVGDFINKWKIIDKIPAGKYHGKQSYNYIVQCTKCNNTQRKLRQSELPRLGEQCQNCMLIERNTKRCDNMIGKKFGHLTVIGDGGYKICDKDGNRKHFSIVICDCGKSKPFEVRDNNLKTGSVSSCGCAKHKSRGEYEIYQVLEKIYPYSFSTEFSFPDLVSYNKGRRLRFDFALFNQKDELLGLIEFDGRQHTFGPDTSTWGRTKDTLETIQLRDKQKNEYCHKKGIPLCRINFKDFAKIENLLQNFINNLLN